MPLSSTERFINYNTKSLSGTEHYNKERSQYQLRPIRHQPPDDYNMILPMLKMTISTNLQGQDELSEEVEWHIGTLLINHISSNCKPFQGPVYKYNWTES